MTTNSPLVLDGQPLALDDMARALAGPIQVEIGPAAADAIPKLRELTDQPIIGFHAATAISRITATD